MHLVYKVGTSTRETVGMFNKLKNKSRITQETYMDHKNYIPDESCFIGHDNSREGSPRFTDTGDPGAIVFNGSGIAVGLRFGA